MIDEREGLPSASAFGRYSKCLGSWMAERNIEEQSNSDSERGTRIHKAIESGDFSGLSEDDRDTAERCILERDKLVDDFLLARKPDIVITEKRFWLKNREGFKVASGKPDYVAIDTYNKRAVIIDYKTGYNDVEPSSSNKQLRALAAIINQNINDIDSTINYLNIAYVGIIAPHSRIKDIGCEYDYKDIDRATDSAFDLVDKISMIGQPRTPSHEACEFCKFRPKCEEHKAWLGSLTAYGKQQLSSDVKIDYLIKSKEVVRILNSCIRNIESDIKSNPDKYPQVSFEDVNGDRYIENAQDAYNVLHPIIGHTSFMDAVSLSITKLEDAYCKSFQGSRVDAKKTFSIIMSDVISKKSQKRLKLPE